MSAALAYTVFGDLPQPGQLARVSATLVAAVILGALIGVQRELMSKPAGVRTHALVALVAAIFTLIPTEPGMLMLDLSRVIQGIATGIGFIGAGVILKLREQHSVIGLTTAATLWVATAIGMAVGLGQLIYAAIGVALIWPVLSGLAAFDDWIARRRRETVDRLHTSAPSKSRDRPR